MADCLGGAWAKHASSTQSSNGETFLNPLTQADIESALSAASAVRDDRIQKKFRAEWRPSPGPMDPARSVRSGSSPATRAVT